MSTERDEDDPDTDLMNGAQETVKEEEKEASIRNPNLPEEIIFHDILSRLPVKPLVKFRCVSKSWRRLISDPHFIEDHLNISKSDENYTNHRVISSHGTNSKPSLKTCSLYSLLYNNHEPTSSPIDAEDIDYPLKDKDQSYRRRDSIVGHCNGLLCLKMGKNKGVMLWNPSINEFKILPDPGISMRVGGHFLQKLVYGFGYDDASNDYKVVAILTRGEGPSETEVRVYSLRTNAWRRISDFPPYGLPDEGEPGTLVSGTLVWSTLRFLGCPADRPHVERIALRLDWKIISLDLATETYREVPQPASDVGYDKMLGTLRGYDKMLGTLGGCLCIMGHQRGLHADLWVMKEFGVRESWTKLFTIPYSGKFVWHNCFPFYLPRNLSKDGKMLMELDSSLVLYNYKDNTFRSPVIRNFNSGTLSCVYIESLVSPNADPRDEG